MQGMHIVKKLPDRPKDGVRPQEFVAGSSEMLEDTLRQVRSNYGAIKPDVVGVWERWKEELPTNDNATEYISK